jgi:MFS family permease
LLSVMIGTMASIMSSTIVNVAIPDMSHHFTLGQERAQWVSSGFMVAMTASMLTTPWLLARYGYRRTYVGTMLLLLAGGVVGGFANHFPLVLAARVAEGLAAGVVQPIPAIIILRAFEPARTGPRQWHLRHGRGAGARHGPQHWRRAGGPVWLALDLLHGGAVLPGSLYMAYRFVPVTSPGGVAANRGGAPLDWRGLLLGSAGTLCLLNGLVELHGSATRAAGLRCWRGGRPLVCLVAAPLLASGREALMNLALYSATGSSPWAASWHSSTAPPCLAPPTCCRFTCSWGCSCRRRTWARILLPSGFVLAVTIAGVGRLADRQPTYLLVSIGLALLAASFAVMVLVDTTTALWVLVAFAILGRSGLGFILPSLNLGAMRGLAGTHPAGSSTINFVRMLGGAAGREPVRHRARMASGRARRLADQLRHQPGAAGGVQRVLPDAGRAVRAGAGGGVATARKKAMRA